jgi:ribosomal protein S18 acetylase RimI-like enzyme
MTSVHVSNQSAVESGLRMINLRTDLMAVADLIELVFADTMDAGGRAAIREMRHLSRLGAGLNLLAGLSEFMQGIGLGFVWIEEGKLVGNVSVYPTEWPSELGRTWVIANVGVHPDYQRRGIARKLMQAAMSLIRERGGGMVLLQVDAENAIAQSLYMKLGFVVERPWISWRRSAHLPFPPALEDPAITISKRHWHEWQHEYRLAQRVRSAFSGGMGWQRPLHPSLFHKPLLQRVMDWINVRGMERYVIRSKDGNHVLASMWVERAAMSSVCQLTLMVEPAYHGLYDEAMINFAVRRFCDQGSHLIIEHPADEETVTHLLRRYQFRVRNEVIHMHWDARQQP